MEFPNALRLRVLCVDGFPWNKKSKKLLQTRHPRTDSEKKKLRRGTSNLNLNSLDRLRKLQLFNNYSSRPNGLLTQRPWGREYIPTDPITFHPDHCRDKRNTKTHTTEKISLKSESCLFKLRLNVAIVNIKPLHLIRPKSSLTNARRRLGTSQALHGYCDNNCDNTKKANSPDYRNNNQLKDYKTTADPFTLIPFLYAWKRWDFPVQEKADVATEKQY